MNLSLQIVCAGLFWAVSSVTTSLPQDLSYHKFAGDGGPSGTGCCGRKIPNTANVLSNIPFAIVGIIGLATASATAASKLAWTGFCWGSIFVAFGSAYYHWQPNNQTLVWDRLPMTLCTTSISWVVLEKYVELSTGDLVSWWLLGMYSVLYWAEHDDLRFYAFMQYFPVLCVLALSLWAPIPGFSWIIVAAIVLYIVARGCEYFDYWFWERLCVSGHVLKHVLCAVAMLWCCAATVAK
jgi:hypothetical protein